MQIRADCTLTISEGARDDPCEILRSKRDCNGRTGEQPDIELDAKAEGGRRRISKVVIVMIEVKISAKTELSLQGSDLTASPFQI